MNRLTSAQKAAKKKADGISAMRKKLEELQEERAKEQEIQTQFRWFRIEEQPRPLRRTIKTFHILSNNRSAVMGIIKWQNAWKQYGLFIPKDCQSQFSRQCLKHINEFMRQLELERC